MSIVKENEPSLSDIAITVIATVRNELSTIEKFVETLLNQSFRPDEIIIVDGLSTDGTVDVLKNYARQGLIKLIVKDCNIAQGRNVAINEAKNEYVAITDAGCDVDVNWLKQIALCFSCDEKPDVVAGNFRFETHTNFERAVVLSTFPPNRDDLDTAKYYPSSRSLAVTKVAWEKVKGYPEWLYAAEDTLFNIRLKQVGCQFVFCRDAIVRWRPRETWRALAKQRFNFARGNARVGIGTQGYIINLKYHTLMILPLIFIPFWPMLTLLCFVPMLSHIKHNLWKHAKGASKNSEDNFSIWRILIVMEFTRIVSLFGFFAGRWDRFIDPKFKSKQLDWMGVDSIDKIDL